MAPLQPVRGTRDLIGEDLRRHRQVAETARRVAGSYGFDEWATPVFEDTRVFARTLGDTSDVVTKEMYSFEDRGGESITLRPEFTAGIAQLNEQAEPIPGAEEFPAVTVPATPEAVNAWLLSASAMSAVAMVPSTIFAEVIASLILMLK